MRWFLLKVDEFLELGPKQKNSPRRLGENGTTQVKMEASREMFEKLGLVM